MSKTFKLFLIFSTLLIFLFLIYKIVLLTFDKDQTLPASYVNWSEEILNKLSLEQKIGQLFLIGFDGKILTPEIEKLLKELHPGGILLLAKNIENEKQLKELVNSLQMITVEDTGLPLFIAIDQEGGPISRIQWIEKTPQSKIENAAQAYQIGKIKGEQLKELGINLNLAPLLDETLFGDFIFERGFQKSPKEVGELAGALIDGQQTAGILTVIKHFPGYSGISFNPEEKLATLSKIPKTSQFEIAMEVQPEMIMVSNVVYQNLDKNLPFTFSDISIKFLKEKLNNEILIISDDLAQNSLLNNFTLKEITALPIKAGVDVLIFSGWRTPVRQGVGAFKEVVENGEISEARINQSVLKVIKLKQKLLKYNNGI